MAVDPLVQVMKKLSLGIGVVGTVATIYLHEKSQENIKKEAYYKRAKEILSGYGPGVKLIGDPIQFRLINVWKRDFNYVDATRVKLNMPFTGKHKRGYLVTWASRESEEESWIVEKLDLLVEKKQWTFYMNPESKFVFKPTQELSEEELKESSDIFCQRKVQSESSENSKTSEKQTMGTNESKDSKASSATKTEKESSGDKKPNNKEEHFEWVK